MDFVINPNNNKEANLAMLYLMAKIEAFDSKPLSTYA